MFKPKIRTEVTHHMNYEDFDTLVNEYITGDQEFESVPMFEWSNGLSYTCKISPDTYPYTQTKIDEVKGFLSRPRTWGISPMSLLWFLAHEGRIPFGEYVVKVSW